jgi:hypothetical protein
MGIFMSCIAGQILSRVIKGRQMAGHVGCGKKMRAEFWLGKLKEREHL